MYNHTWTTLSINAHRSELKRQVNELIPLKESVLKEAYASALGFRTEAALSAALKSSPVLSSRPFDENEFVERIAKLTDDATADVVIKVLKGINLDISVVKHLPSRQRAEMHSDIVYDVDVKLKGISASLLGSEIIFHLPEFGRGAGVEPYRVDSAHDRRAAADYKKTRFGTGQGTLVAKLVQGQWHGEFFVYAPEHQADDTQSIRSLRAALARAILPQLPTQVRCSIFRPDNYQVGAWRIELRLSEGIKRFWGSSPFHFDIPKLPKRFFQMESDYRADVHLARFVDGVWKADLYTNGVEEVDNPTSIDAVRRALLESIDGVALSAGFRDEGVITPVFDEEGGMVGTVQLRGGLFEAWHRSRAADRAGNVHKLLGRFDSLEDALIAVRSNAQYVVAETHLTQVVR
jgi:hypothetical protein